MTPFQNQQIHSSQLPRVQDILFEGIEKDYLKILLFYTSISNVIIVIFITVFLIWRPFPVPSAIIALVIILAVIRILWSYIRTIKSFPYKAYALREKDIVYKSGWLWRHMVTAPFNRVQHLQIDQGVIERRLNLAKLKIYTAGGSSSDITIPGLRPETAAKLKQFIVTKTSLDEEE